jgi:hypothetical protein
MQIDVVYAGFLLQFVWNKRCELFQRTGLRKPGSPKCLSYVKVNFTTCEYVAGGKAIGLPQGLK